ncbi:MAG TPA: hypothetical protein VM686_03580 [Polyangiaceae bacterium]|jgi:hypothetical protein|nr:hypothetical protein [Polyangiaceae bacterium]
MRTCWLLSALALLACKGESEQASRPLPAPEPPSTTKSELTPASVAPEPRKERPTREVRAEEDRPKPTESDPAPTAATSTAPAATAEAEPKADPSCQQACQTGLQTCLSQQPPDPDGGTSMDGLAACKKALDECKARCSP